MVLGVLVVVSIVLTAFFFSEVYNKKKYLPKMASIDFPKLKNPRRSRSPPLKSLPESVDRDEVKSKSHLPAPPWLMLLRKSEEGKHFDGLPVFKIVSAPPGNKKPQSRKRLF
jgi:hypothetical protein